MFITIDFTNVALIHELAQLTYRAFQVHPPNWLPSETDAKHQVLRAAETDRINRVLLSPNATPIGWSGVIPINHGRIWEIHPLAISPAQQGHGYGRMLVQEDRAACYRTRCLGLAGGDE